jgi:hypothetical protein
MEYKISSYDFWYKLKDIYPVIHKSYHLKDKRIQKISISIIGLEFIRSDFSNDISEPYGTDYIFKIIDKEKLTWAKIAYGI